MKNYRNNFNLLRFILASLVIVSHVPELQYGNRSKEILTSIFKTISFGEMAVDCFFLLSGFLIVKSWVEKPNIIYFLQSRILRIYPGFIVASIVCALIVGPIYGIDNYLDSFEWINFISGLTILNLTGTPAVFQETYYPTLNSSMWSISYEFKCYLLVLIFGISGTLSRKHLWLLMFLIFATIHLINRLNILKIPFDLYFRCFMAFFAGGCFYLYKNKIPWSNQASIISILIFIVSLFIKPLAEISLCIFFGYSMIHYAMSGEKFLAFNRYPDVSYGIYLYAWPINKVILWHYPNINTYAAIVIVFILSLFLGAISYYTVERPFMRIKYSYTHKA